MYKVLAEAGIIKPSLLEEDTETVVRPDRIQRVPDIPWEQGDTEELPDGKKGLDAGTFNPFADEKPWGAMKEFNM